MAEPVLLIERDAGVVTLTLNRPNAMNALSRELRVALVDAFTTLEFDPDARVVILTGAGRAFCAGLDLKELGRGAGPLGAGSGEEPNVIKAIASFARADHRRDQRRGGHRRLRAGAGLRRADRLERGALRRYTRACRHHARLGPVAEALARDRDLARQGALAHRQLPGCRDGRRLGAGESRGRARGAAADLPASSRRT